LKSNSFQAFYVTIQNISKCCPESDSELGDFTADLFQGQLSDQELSGRLVLPMDIDYNAEIVIILPKSLLLSDGNFSAI